MLIFIICSEIIHEAANVETYPFVPFYTPRYPNLSMYSIHYANQYNLIINAKPTETPVTNNITGKKLRNCSCCVLDVVDDGFSYIFRMTNAQFSVAANE